MNEFRYQWNKGKESFMLWFAFRVPKWLVYWCAIRLGANATGSDYPEQVVPELNFMDALDRWEK